MWGFNLKAYSGNTTFVRNTGGSTEGELWMKYVFKKTVPDQIGKTVTGLMDGIEAQFGGVKKALLQAVRGVEREFFLSVWDGDSGRVLMVYHFKPETPYEIVESEFLSRLQRSGYEIGDQVMILMCDVIARFEAFLMLNQNQADRAILPTLVIEIFF